MTVFITNLARAVLCEVKILHFFEKIKKMSLQDKILKRKLKKKENQKLKILKNRQQENDNETEESSEVPVSDVENQTVAKRKHEEEEIGTVPL